MFLNIYTKRIRTFTRNWEMLFWTWLFPVMMATLFYFAFSNLNNTDLLNEIPTGIITNQGYAEDMAFQMTLNAVSSESDNPLFNLYTYETEEEAKEALRTKEIEGYIFLEKGTPHLAISANGLNQTILKSFLNQYIQAKHTITDILSAKAAAETGSVQLQAIMEEISELFNRESLTQEISLSKNAPSQTVMYFYALLAMTCMYGGFQGMESISFLQANLSPLGARRTLSPAKRISLVVFDLLGAFTVHFLCLLFLLAYMIFILGISFGSNLFLVILTCAFGSLLGIVFGALITAATPFKAGMKTALIISISLLCSYGAGLMMSGVNYTIARHLPVLSWINPAARIADALYCLYYYDGYSQYFLNLAVLSIMIMVMLVITTFFVRRQRYESI